MVTSRQQASEALERASDRIAALESQLEAFRVVLVTVIEPGQLQVAARLLGTCLRVSDRHARSLLGLPEPLPAELDATSATDGPPLQLVPVARSIFAADEDA